MRRDYEFGPQLGRGSFGVVFKVRRKADGCAFVCKELALKSMGKKAREEANQEVRLLRKVSSGSRYIVQYIASFLEGDCLHIIMEFCEHGDLSGLVKGRGGQLMEERSVWKFLIQISLGLRWLHKNRILHRDIKTLNVFLTSCDDARLGDLGVARVLSHNTNFADTFVGTPYYLSPELCEEKPYNELSDVWAFGCVVYEMCTLKHPFEAKNHAALLIKILRGQFAPISLTYSAELRGLIDGCMRRDWTRRTKLADLVCSAPVKSWAERLGVALEEPQPGGAAKPPEEARAAPKAAWKPQPAPVPKPPAGLAAVPKPRGQPVARRLSSPASAGPPRARDRRLGDRRAGGVRRVTVAEESPARTIVAAPSSRTAAQVVRSAPRGGSSSRQPPPPHVALPPQPSRTPSGSPAATAGPGYFRRPASSEMRSRRAAREVADLPDVVVPAAPRTARNVPSVHQLLQLEPEPVRPESAGSLAGRSSPGPTEPAEAAEVSTSEDMTMLPEDTMMPEQSEVAEEVQEDSALQEEEARRPFGYPISGGGLPRPPDLGGELTVDSAFATQRQGLADSLMYTAEESLAPTAEGSLRSRPASAGPALVEWVVDVEPSPPATPPGEVEESSLPSEQAKLDSDGLLCDAHWQPPSPAERQEQQPAEEEDEEEPSREEEQSGEALSFTGTVVQVPRRERGKLSTADRASAKAAKLTAQIARLHAEVVRDMDGPAQAVWRELYHLFHAKMSVDLTDEDQSEIERYVFEQLPTESTDLIWKVYKLLHLEQERDLALRALAG